MKKRKVNKGPNKNLIVIIVTAVSAIIIAGVIIYFVLNNRTVTPGGNNNNPTTPVMGKEEIPVEPSVTKAMEFEKYSNSVFSMNIPKGWVVSTMGANIHYGFRVYDKNDSRYQIFVYLKMEPFLKSSAAASKYKSFYNLSKDKDYAMFASSTVLKAQSTEGFYKSFMTHIKFMKGSYGKQFYGNVSKHAFPELNSLKILDSITPKVNGGGQNEKILRMNFTNSKKKTGQGLFSASVMKATPYYIDKVDMSPVLVYTVVGISSAEDDFVSYEPILMKCLNSLEYSASFVSSTQQKSKADAAAARKMNASMQAAFDSYNSAWSARQTKYDVSSQKTSDSTLGYDRIKNPDTGEVYRAEVGWYDNYDLNRGDYNNSNLQLVNSDSDYIEPVSGYIYK